MTNVMTELVIQAPISYDLQTQRVGCELTAFLIHILFV